MTARLLLQLPALTLLLPVALPACNPKVLDFDPVGEERADVCAADTAWLPATAEPGVGTPAPHPVTECPFYRIAFQHFLRATEVDASGEPRLASAPTPDDVFARARPLPSEALAPAGTHRGTPARAWLGAVRQTGSNAILVDQDHHTLYYGVHVNQPFVDFVQDRGLDTVDGIVNADQGLQVPPGVVLMRSAWKDIDPADGVSGDFSHYVTTNAWVSRVIRDASSGKIVEHSEQPRLIRVALVALHIAFGLRGHPELVWTTFEHGVGFAGSDVAPANLDINPDPLDPSNLGQSTAVDARTSLLYRGGTPANRANIIIPDESMKLDELTQTLTPATPVYRVFPASRSHTTAETAVIASLNQNVGALFTDKIRAGQVGADDPRAWYRLVGGLWLDKPGFFAADASLQNDATSPMVTGDHVDLDGKVVGPVAVSELMNAIAQDGTDSPLSIQGGTDRLSSTAMESFTQSPIGFANCLTCHNTRSVSIRGTPFDGSEDTQPAVVAPKMINVVRLFSRFVVDQCGQSAGCPD